METTPAILLRRTRFSETSLVISWLTQEHGRLKTLARGALRPKSAFAGGLDLFFECEIAFTRSARSELHPLREAALRNPRDGLRHDYGRVELAAYFVELVELAVEPEHPVPEVFSLLQRALGYMETHAPERRVLLHFENELARALGIAGAGAGGGNGAEALFHVAHRLPAARAGLLARWR